MLTLRGYCERVKRRIELKKYGMDGEESILNLSILFFFYFVFLMYFFGVKVGGLGDFWCEKSVKIGCFFWTF